MTKPAIDFWYDFASTYSYVAAMRIDGLAETAGVTVRWRPFLLGPIFQAQGWNNSPFNIYPAKGRNMVRDMERLCDELGIGFRLPGPFPQNSLLAARLALAGLDEGWGEAFSRAVYSAEFGDGVTISEPSVLGDLLRQLGQSPDAAFARAQSDTIKTKLRDQTTEAQQRGIYGAPSFTTEDGDLFWGNDRLEQALRWAAKK